MAASEVDRAFALLRAMREEQAGDRPTLDEIRARYAKLLNGLGLWADVEFESVDARGVPAIWARPRGMAATRTILYVHGGGWVSGTAMGFRDLAGRIGTASGARVLIADYGLVPEHRFPSQIDQVVDAYRWLLDGGTDPRSIVVAGDSAGGGLAAAAVLRLRDDGHPAPAGLLLLSPVLDLACTGASMDANAATDPVVERAGVLTLAGLYLGDEDPRGPYASPLYADLAGLPPTLIQVSAVEALLDDALRFAERAGAAGGDVVVDRADGMPHVWQLFASFLPQAVDAIELAGRFVQAHAVSGKE